MTLSDVATLTHLRSRLVNTPLMIDSDKLSAILHVVGPRMGLSGFDQGQLEFAAFDKLSLVLPIALMTDWRWL